MVAGLFHLHWEIVPHFAPPLPPHPSLRCICCIKFHKACLSTQSKIQGNTSCSREYVILFCSEHYNYTDSCREVGYDFINTPRSQVFFPLYGKSRGSEDAKCPARPCLTKTIFTPCRIAFRVDTKSSQNFALRLFAFNQGRAPQFLLSYYHFLSNKRLSISF